MKRLATIVLLAMLGGALAGCGTAGTPAAGSSETSATAAASAQYVSMPISGAQERAAVAALPAALKAVAKSTKESGNKATDVGGAKPALVFYTVSAVVGDDLALFEVHADGKAYGLYGYPTPPDPKRLNWQTAANNTGAVLAKPVSGPELGAVAAVTSLVKLARPKDTATVRIMGYTFVWLGADGKPVMTPGGQVFTITVDPKGTAASWSM